MPKSSCAKLIVKSITLILLGTGASQAGLVNRGGGLIYDDVKNLTWMQDTHYTYTSGFNATGLLGWEDATEFARNLEFYDRARDVTWSDWRLPTAVNSPQSVGYDPTGASSELAFMYYVNLGLVPIYQEEAKHGFIKNDWFTNLLGRAYWTDTPAKPGRSAWEFQFGFGVLETDGISDDLRLWLVRDGDVGLATNLSVPEPGSLALFSLGLAGVAFMRRRRIA